jgi:hypothetical protein
MPLQTKAVKPVQISAGSGSPLLEDEENRTHHEDKSDQVIPFQVFPQVQDGETAEDDEGDALLNGLQLSRREFITADPAGGNLETILEKAISQLTRTAVHKGESLYFRCPYQAKVMKMFEMSRRPIVLIKRWWRWWESNPRPEKHP